MSHNHTHDHEPHEHHSVEVAQPDEELSPAQLSRRGLMRSVGLLGAGAAAVNVLGEPGEAHAHGREHDRDFDGDLRWLAGDHHIHTQYSSDAMYRVTDQARHARAYGLDWIVITDHGSNAHARIGVEKVNPDIRAAREQLRDLLIYQGLEWNIPAAEHGTVFVAPGPNEVAVLKEFENGFDGSVRGAGDPTPANEALATQGIQFHPRARPPCRCRRRSTSP